MSIFTSVSYRRTFNLGNYESVTIEATVQVDETTDAVTALNDAQTFVMEQAGTKHHQVQPAYPKSVPQTAPGIAPASEKQRAYIDSILFELGWDAERVQAFATERQWNMLTLDKAQASMLIDALKRVRDGEISEPAAPAPTPVVADDLPF